MDIEAKILLDSISPAYQRVTTFELNYHRFVHAEFMTHRVFSRNAGSSRAIPVEKSITAVKNEPAFPIEWRAEQKGMQGGTELEGRDLIEARYLFEDVHRQTVARIERYLESHPKESRLHKSLINRLLEPFSWIKVIVTATDWEGYWFQRCSPDELYGEGGIGDAMPEIRLLADTMLKEYRASEPQFVDWGQWHAPLLDDEDFEAIADLAMDRTDAMGQANDAHIYLAEEIGRQVSAARCARVSYLTHHGTRDIEEDIRLFERLAMREPGSRSPSHWSPLEHVCTPHTIEHGLPRGNLTGWRQYRHELEYDD